MNIEFLLVKFDSCNTQHELRDNQISHPLCLWVYSQRTVVKIYKWQTDNKRQSPNIYTTAQSVVLGLQYIVTQLLV